MQIEIWRQGGREVQGGKESWGSFGTCLLACLQIRLFELARLRSALHWNLERETLPLLSFFYLVITLLHRDKEYQGPSAPPVRLHSRQIQICVTRKVWLVLTMIRTYTYVRY